MNHIAIIMDGNGRWARARGEKRTNGHEMGAVVVRQITQKANAMGIKYLTLYAFSTENWKRPKMEVEFLMKLLAKYVDSERDTYLNNNIRFKTIGDVSKLSQKLRFKLNSLENDTATNSGIVQVLAINYGSQDEIRRAALQMHIKGGDIEEYLDTLGMPPVDILIRTGGEKRLSNFLLWQAAYAELFFTDTLWPDFNETEFDAIVSEFETRNRRFGGL